MFERTLIYEKGAALVKKFCNIISFKKFQSYFHAITISLKGALSPVESSPELKSCYVGYTKLNKHTSHSGRMKVILLGLDLEKDSNHENGFLMNTILCHKLRPIRYNKILLT